MAKVKIGDTWVGDGEPAYVVAEIGLNHNGDVEIAKKMVEVAINARCNAVKLQKRYIPQTFTKDVLDQISTYPRMGKTVREFRERLELNLDEYRELKRMCQGKIHFIVTAFDIPSLEFIDEVGVDAYKIAAHCITNIPLIEALRKVNKPIILSTGMTTMEEIEYSVNILKGKDLILLHCVSRYPCMVEECNLRVINTLKEKFPDIPIGYSGHENGIAIAVAAAAMGACLIEKHITLDRTMEGPDQAFSIEPYGLSDMVARIRKIELARGTPEKRILPREMECFDNFRRSIVAAKNIAKGSIITRDQLTTKAPFRGLSPRFIPEVVGKKATMDIKEDDPIQFAMIE